MNKRFSEDTYQMIEESTYLQCNYQYYSLRGSQPRPESGHLSGETNEGTIDNYRGQRENAQGILPSADVSHTLSERTLMYVRQLKGIGTNLHKVVDQRTNARQGEGSREEHHVTHLHQHLQVIGKGSIVLGGNNELVTFNNVIDHSSTLYKELSISAWPMFRLFAGGCVSCCGVAAASALSFSSAVASSSAKLRFTCCVGLNAPHILKLSLASFHCSTKYGKADSRKLPMICREMSRPASC